MDITRSRCISENPQFFESTPTSSPTFSSRTRTAATRSRSPAPIVTLRERIPISDRLRRSFGGENDQISERLHRSTLALIAARISGHARRALSQPEGGLRRAPWRVGCGAGAGAVVPAELAATARDSANMPTSWVRRRGGVAPFESASGSMPARAASHSRSCPAYRVRSGSRARRREPRAVPFRYGTVYLMRLAELASVALSRYLPPA